MAAPMRDATAQQPDGGHRPRVADATRSAKPDNFVEYDDNEWDIGIGDLIIDLDADIEKTNEVPSAANMSSATGGGLPASSGGVGSKSKMAIEHSATVDKGLKMKIKRTKPGTKTSEAKHEIVKSNELNGTSAPDSGDKGSKHGSGNQSGPGGQNAQTGAGGASGACGPGAGGAGVVVPAGPGVVNNSAKRGSSGHRRDKTRDKHTTTGAVDKQVPNSVKTTGNSGNGAGIVTPALVVTPDVNGVVRATVAPQTGAGAGINAVTPSGAGGGNASGPTAGAAMTAPGSGSTGPSRAVFPASTGPGPPAPGNAPGGGVAAGAGVGQPTSPAKPEQGGKVPAIVLMPSPASTPNTDDRGSPPPKKLKTSVDPKDMVDVCVGTSVGTITEPDCLGPCEPGTSVTLEGIVWHETEGGVLVVNVTWRGKTYVGTLLDCTRHDWAPPRFCDSPTSDLDSRTPKGRGKRGRGNTTTATTPGGDLSNFTETRSSVHSKLRNGGAKGRRGAAAAAASTGATASTTTTTTSSSAGNAQNSTATTASNATSGTASPTPFVPPRVDNKRKGGSRAGDDDTPPATNTKKSKSTTVPASPAITPVSGSPPTSPVLLECPEPNCSKKYKHINGLKYHQSHAHGSAAEDDDTKDITSMSENDESNIEAPSPATPVKSPEKVVDAPLTPQKKEEPSVVISTPLSSVLVPDIPSEPGTPKSRPVTPQPPSILTQPPQEILPNLAQPLVETKSVVKPGVLRYGQTEDYTFANKPPGTPSVPTGASIRTVNPTPPQNNQSESILQNPSLYTNQSSPIQPQINNMQQQIHVMNMGPSTQNVNVQSPGQAAKLPQFKVKPTATLMPDDKKDRNKPPGYKKKNRKSPASSPHPQPELPTYGVDTAGREDVQSPAYSDISDDTAPPLEAEVGDKSKTPSDKKTETGQPLSHTMPQYGMYPFYGQPPYLVPSENKPKDIDKDKPVTDKDGKKDGSEFQQKVLPQHYYSYGYMQGYPYNIEAPYSAVSMVPEDKIKEERLKDSISPVEHNKSIPNSIQVPSTKVKNEPGVKEKHPNENHQIIKESIEMKSQMSSYLYQRPSTQTQQTQNNHNVHHSHSQQQQQQQQREEEIRRYYLYSDQRRKESQGIEQQRTSTTPKTNLQASPGVKHKEKQPEEKKDKEVKQEGVKPTMETQGPPPPPTSQYAYIHPSYMQSPGHYNAIPFDPNHPMYRSMLMHTPYGGNPYLHPQMPRYHAPEDLSRPPQAPAKALDILQHHANQYYTSHKIHELQERAMKSPTPKTSVASTSPSNTGPVTPTQGSGVPAGPLQTQGNQIGPPQGGKQTPGDGKDSRSPPPQRHVHTHHHTHVGLGYPILAGQYPATYGAAVLASQQAAAVTVINPYPPK